MGSGDPNSFKNTHTTHPCRGMLHSREKEQAGCVGAEMKRRSSSCES